jgi:hypothetical protein
MGIGFLMGIDIFHGYEFGMAKPSGFVPIAISSPCSLPDANIAVPRESRRGPHSELQVCIQYNSIVMTLASPLGTRWRTSGIAYHPVLLGIPVTVEALMLRSLRPGLTGPTGQWGHI